MLQSQIHASQKAFKSAIHTAYKTATQNGIIKMEIYVCI